jgi:phosphatidylglycerophosphate synthase
MKDIREHFRVNDILLGPIERPVLKWFASRMPAWVTPDQLTALGTLGALLIALSYWLTNFDLRFIWIASLGLVINWFGDSLDGTLARYRNIQRPQYGFFIDHTIDSLNEVIIFLGFGLSPFVRFELAALALIGYLLMSILVYVRTCVKGEFVISYAGFGPTEVRVLAIIMNTWLFFFGNPVLPIGKISGTLVDWLVLIVALALFAVFVYSTYAQAKELAESDPGIQR